MIEKPVTLFVCRLVFTVVSDPPGDEGDCVDVAYASVDFVQVGILFTYVRSAERQRECLQEFNLSLQFGPKLSRHDLTAV